MCIPVFIIALFTVHLPRLGSNLNAHQQMNVLKKM